jgi:hypothetical protein
MRATEDQANVKAQAKVLDALKAQLLAATKTLALLTNVSIDSAAEATTDTMRPCDAEGIRANAWRAKSERQHLC